MESDRAGRTQDRKRRVPVPLGSGGADTHLMPNQEQVVGAQGLRLMWVGLLASGAVLACIGLLYLRDSLAALVLVFAGLFLTAVGVRGLRARVVVSPDEMRVFNVFRNFRLARGSVREIETWPKDPVAKIAPRVVIRTRGGDAITPTALQMEGSITSSEDRYAVVRACADRLVNWQRSGQLS